MTSERADAAALPELESPGAGDPSPADPDPAGPESQPTAQGTEPVVVPRWVQAISVTAVLLAVSALARASRPVLLLFIVAGVIALILNPLVKVLQRVGLPRGVAIVAVLLSFVGAAAGTVALLVNPVTNQIQAFQDDLPDLIDNANGSLEDLQQSLDRRGLDIQIARRGETALETLRSNVLEGSGDILAFARELVTVLVEAGFALILIFVIAIYMLLYGRQIGGLIRRVMPPGDGTPEDDYPIQVQKAVFGYVRGQLTFSLVMGVSAGASLWVFGALGIFPAGQTYAVFFGVFYGVMELIPYVGPVLGSAPAILVALFQGEPLTALWLALLFLVLQQIEGHIVAPQIFSHSLRINPLVVIAVLLIGGHLEGIVGAIVALPIAAITRETYLYLRRHLVLEPWGTPSAAAVRDEVATVASRPVLRRCPHCGTSTTPSAEFCFACGTPVRPHVGQPGGDQVVAAPRVRLDKVRSALPRGLHLPGRSRRVDRTALSSPDGTATDGTATDGTAIVGAATGGAATSGAATGQTPSEDDSAERV
ncbi:MAG TPA: AI-2E family transporter [Mycobacteriales bacterium]|nr:AI-2E family transporter [Mycobacteriales bacterium]